METRKVKAQKVNGKAVFLGRELKKAMAGAKGFVIVGGVIVPARHLKQYAQVMTRDTLTLTVAASDGHGYGAVQFKTPGHRTRFLGVAPDDLERVAKWHGRMDTTVTQLTFEEVA